MENKILLSIDLEEFDLPLEYSTYIDKDEQIRISKEGMKNLEHILNKYNIKSTIFTTAFWANENKEYIKQLSENHEIGSHAYFHSDFSQEFIQSSKQEIESIIKKEVAGFRMPRMMEVDNSKLMEAGYKYNSSLNPTYIIGKYNHFFKNKNIHVANGVIQVPTSVSNLLRIPLFWLSIKVFPISYYQFLCKKVLKKNGYLLIYIHPWEFVDLSKYKIPNLIKSVSGKEQLNRFENIISYLSTIGSFSTINDYLNENFDKKNDNHQLEKIATNSKRA
ncbi:MAG: polysaccharide deacetylase family protein [Saprospiraceae bacterium]|nr:polysaccharide deacetylase family protein [Saprospiraceae bacterium]